MRAEHYSDTAVHRPHGHTRALQHQHTSASTPAHRCFHPLPHASSPHRSTIAANPTARMAEGPDTNIQVCTKTRPSLGKDTSGGHRSHTSHPKPLPHTRHNAGPLPSCVEHTDMPQAGRPGDGRSKNPQRHQPDRTTKPRRREGQGKWGGPPLRACGQQAASCMRRQNMSSNRCVLNVMGRCVHQTPEYPDSGRLCLTTSHANNDSMGRVFVDLLLLWMRVSSCGAWPRSPQPLQMTMLTPQLSADIWLRSPCV